MIGQLYCRSNSSSKTSNGYHVLFFGKLYNAYTNEPSWDRWYSWLAILLSENRRAIRLRTVIGAFLIQFGFGAFVLYVPAGQQILAGVSSGVGSVMGYANAGITFLFGDLANGKTGFVFAINVLTVIIFFSSLVAVLYHLGIMQRVINLIGGAFQKLLGTSQPESLSATANIFVSQNEAPLVIRPYVNTMTRSELFTVMVGGMASVAGSVLAGYVAMGVEMKYLIAASFMAAPGGLLMAKIILPETEKPSSARAEEVATVDKPANVIDAAASGAANGMKLAVSIGAMLLAFIALIALLNGILGGVGGWFGMPELSLSWILGYAFAPFSLLLGVPFDEMVQVGSLIGQKFVVNEFVAFVSFIDVREALSAHSQLVVSFALCGFANLSSIAIQLGGLGVMAPSRRGDIARLGLKAVLAGTLSNFMSAAIAGFFFVL